jgi:hypothetical protein
MTGWIAFVAVIAFVGGALTTYGFLGRHIRADERERMRADEHFFGNLEIEKEFWPKSKGFVWKENSVVVRERLWYKGNIPLTEWIEREHKINDELDTKEVESFVHSVSQLVSELKAPLLNIPLPIKTRTSRLPERKASDK